MVKVGDTVYPDHNRHLLWVVEDMDDERGYLIGRDMQGGHVTRWIPANLFAGRDSWWQVRS